MTAVLAKLLSEQVSSVARLRNDITAAIDMLSHGF